MSTPPPASTLKQLRESGWRPRTVKAELRENMTRALAQSTKTGEDLFPGIVGYSDTVIPEVVNAVLAGHDILFLGEKGQAKSRLMRLLTRFLDAEIPYLDIRPETGGTGVSPVHEDPTRPITGVVRDSSHAIVPDAALTLRNVATDQTVAATVSGPDGEYSFRNLAPAKYEVKAATR